MIGGSDVLWGGVVPAIVAAVTLALAWRMSGKAASAWRTGLVVGYVVGHWALDARTISVIAALSKSYQPTEARDWLPLLALLTIVPDALACVGKLGPAIGWVLRVALCAFIPWRLLYGSTYIPIKLLGVDFDMGGWSTAEAMAWIGGIAVVLLLGWQSSRMIDQPKIDQRGVRVRSALAMVVALGGAITVAMSAYLTGGLMLGVLTAVLAGCGLASAFLSTERGPDAAAGPLVVTYGSVLLVAHFYAELKIHNAMLLFVAMVLAIGWLPLPAKLSPQWQAVVRSVVCLVVLGTAVTLAGLDFAATQAATESNPYQSFGTQ